MSLKKLIISAMLWAVVSTPVRLYGWSGDIPASDGTESEAALVFNRAGDGLLPALKNILAGLVRLDGHIQTTLDKTAELDRLEAGDVYGLLAETRFITNTLNKTLSEIRTRFSQMPAAPDPEVRRQAKTIASYTSRLRKDASELTSEVARLLHDSSLDAGPAMRDTLSPVPGRDDGKGILEAQEEREARAILAKTSARLESTAKKVGAAGRWLHFVAK